MERGEPLPRQPTSRSAVYHNLQRYGAWVALTRFANVFTPQGAIILEKAVELETPAEGVALELPPKA